jgi:hypothetical protein
MVVRRRSFAAVWRARTGAETEHSTITNFRRSAARLSIIFGLFGLAPPVAYLDGTFEWWTAPASLLLIAGGVCGIVVWRTTVDVWASRRYSWWAAGCTTAGSAWIVIGAALAG